jgi:hypothetical protein
VKLGEEVVERREEVVGRGSWVVGRGARLKVDAEGGFGERVGGGIYRELQPRTKEDQWEGRAQISKPPRRGNDDVVSLNTLEDGCAHSNPLCQMFNIYGEREDAICALASLESFRMLSVAAATACLEADGG